MKILVIVQYWYPFEDSGQPIYGGVFKDLLQKGHQITILTAFPFFRKGFPEKWAEYRGKLYQKDTWQGATVIRTYVFAPRYRSEKLALFFRGLNFLSFFLSSVVAGLFLPKPDLVLTPSYPPLLSGLSARIISIVKRTSYIYSFQDVFPDNAAAAGLIKNTALLKLLNKLGQYVYRHAGHLLVISNTMKQVLRDKGLAAESITVIPNYCDTEFIKPGSRDNQFAREHDLLEKFVVMFAGNIGLVQDTGSIIKAAEILKDYHDILFVFVGRGEKKENIEQMVKHLDLANVNFITFQPLQKMPDVWATADVGLVTLQKGISSYAVPSKTYGIMASGRPVLAMIDEGSEVWHMVQESQCGLCVPPESPTLLAEAVLQLHRNSQELGDMGKKARAYVVQHYQRENISSQYESLFLKLIER
ncbi:glycosyltransferase family 4 protein [candidate division CSSED10-310 bacterium]|uniref:Glycosyltransferase family 4 protein n=1 Tax=candidate division CSSED10-310 bacterium TaxID=2855610 RepID=A0ABV6Z4V9_UNCC1